MDDKEKVLIIINPVSGTGKQKSALKAIERGIDRINFDYEISETQYAGHATELARQAASKGYDIVVAVGGDGTVNEVAAGLVDTQTKMGIIPCGSGNGLARSLKIPVSRTKAVEVLNENRMKRIDTMSVNGNFCASIAGIGFDALIAKEFQEKPKNTRGLHSYVQLIATKYPTYKANEYKIEIDGQSSLNNLDHSHRVKILQGKSIKICNNINEYANIDGEAKKVGKTVDITIKHKSLMVIC